MTQGTLHDLPCPHCGMWQDPSPDGVRPEFGKVIMFAHECTSCKRYFYVTASWEVVTRGEKVQEIRS
jgi:hypothetical protein